MPSVVSFPNFLCLLLTGVLVVHIVTRDTAEVGLPEVTDDLEVIFCRLPQSRRVDDSRKCSSAQKLFSLLKNGCSLERRMLQLDLKSNETELEEETDQEVVKVEEEEMEVVEESVEEQPEEKMKSTLVDSFVISLLVCSAVATLLEWHRERSRAEEKTRGEGGGGGGTGGEIVSDRRISLVDLTVNRHIRRRDSQQAEAVRQGGAQGSRPPLLRRSSFPAQIPEARPRHAPQRQQSIPAATRRMSIDLEDDGSPDRRRVRIIRRH